MGIYPTKAICLVQTVFAFEFAFENFQEESTLQFFCYTELISIILPQALFSHINYLLEPKGMVIYLNAD
jgi:lysine/ornithine N-monooxygenase